MIAKFRKNKRPRKHRKESVFFSIFLTILFFCVIGLLIISNVKINQRRGELNSRIESLKTEMRALEEEKQILEAQVSQTEMESYLEKEARERFNLKKPGEEVVAFTKEKAEPGQQTEQEKTFLQKILEKLKF